MTNHSPISPNTIIGPYRVVRELGRGASAVVVEAAPIPSEDHLYRPSHHIALKVRVQGEADLDERFRREFETLRGLRLPGVARVYDAGEDNGRLWFAMDIVDGTPLREWIQKGEDTKQRCRRAMESGSRLCRILETIHRHGFVHRDLKPSNVLVGADEKVTVLDFGVVRWQYRSSTITDRAGLVGTMPFMAPEQLTGISNRPESDMFAVGLMLFEGINGLRPRPRHAHEWMRIQCLESLPALACLNRDIPSGLSGLIQKLLNFDPTERPNAVHTARALEELLHKENQTNTPRWPSPAKMHGRSGMCKALLQATESSGSRILIIKGPTGSGRRRLVEELRRYTILRGVASAQAHAGPDRPAEPFRVLLESLLCSVEPWTDRLSQEECSCLNTLWPTLAISSVPDTAQRPGEPPDLQQLANALTAALQAAAESHAVLLVIHDFDQVDPITAQLVRVLSKLALPKITLVLVIDDRWMNSRATKLVQRMLNTKRAKEFATVDLSSEAATSIARDLAPHADVTDIGPCSPQRAVEHGLHALAKWRGEQFDTVPQALMPMGFAKGPLPEIVVKRLLSSGENVDDTHKSLQSLLDLGLLRMSTRSPRMLSIAEPVHITSARACTEDRRAVESRMAEIIDDTWSNPEAHAHIASHQLHGLHPDEALCAAAQAGLAAEVQHQTLEARRWLLVVDQLPHGTGGAIFDSLRFARSRCRANVALSMTRGVPRDDLVKQAIRRAVTPREQWQAKHLQAILRNRQGNPQAALAILLSILHENSPGTDKLSGLRGKTGIAAADLCLQLGLTKETRQYLEQAHSCLVPTQKNAADSTTSPAIQHGLLHEWRRAKSDMLIYLGQSSGVPQIVRNTIGQLSSNASPYLIAKLHRSMGAALTDLGDWDDAADHLWLARNQFDALCREPDMATVTILLAQLALERGEMATASLLLSPGTLAADRLQRTDLCAMAYTTSLRLSCLMGDANNAQVIMRRFAKLDCVFPRWQAALTGWLRIDGQHEACLSLGEKVLKQNVIGISHVDTSIEMAHSYLDLGFEPDAQRLARKAQTYADNLELPQRSLLARIIAGAAEPKNDKGWSYVQEIMVSGQWVIGQLRAMEMGARRATSQGNFSAATEEWGRLAQRAAEHGVLGVAKFARERLECLAHEEQPTDR